MAPRNANLDAIPRRTLHDELVERLRSLVTAGELPAGKKIPERELCDRFGVSRTPLREALKVLAAEGIVTLLPNRGAVVSALTLAELDDLFPIIAALESLSGELACQHVTDREIAAVERLHDTMVGHWRSGDLQRYFRLNQAIHEAIVEATRNEALKTTYRGLSGRVFNMRYVANMSKKQWSAAVAEHREIIRALRLRDGRRLSRVLKQHVAHKLTTVKSWLASAGRTS